MYYLEDYSLGEIANISNVSRQAIYDNIRRTEKVLESYEEKLHLYKKFNLRQELFASLKSSISNQDDEALMLNIIKQLENID